MYTFNSIYLQVAIALAMSALNVLKVVKNNPAFHPCGAGIHFSRQNLTSADVRFWRLKSIPAL